MSSNINGICRHYHIQYINEKWIIQLYADPARIKNVKYKNYTIVSVEAEED
jgi:hypothetical protein